MADRTVLCSFCWELAESLADNASSPGTKPHHADFGHLVSSGETCFLCRSMTSLLNRPESFQKEVADKTKVHSVDEYPVTVGAKSSRHMPSGVGWALIEVSLESPNSSRRWLSIFTILSHHLRGKNFIMLHELCIPTKILSLTSLDPETDPTSVQQLKSESTLDGKVSVIKPWLQECRSHPDHITCRPAPFAPRRLISVGLDGNPIRIVEEHAPLDKTEYATLSYCWGGSLQLRTTKETLTQFSEEIPWELLPKTFADAINVAQKLEIPYIWIDALCIVQNDERDWQQQAAQMGDIFAGSQLTITASQSMNSSQGCFCPDANGRQDGELLSCIHEDHPKGPGLLVRYYINDIRGYALKYNIISERGWTLQEQLLSPRVISCMQAEVHWQCRGHYQTEGGLGFEPKEMLQLESYVRTPSLHPSLLGNDLWCRATWRLIAENYSMRKFTYERDRVPAIAGITGYFASLMDDTPILGLWKRSIAIDLAWLAIEPAQCSAVPELPSWSWLNCPNVAYYLWHGGTSIGAFSQQQDARVKLLSCDIEWQSTRYTSPIRKAELQVQGPVREILIRSSEEGNARNPACVQVFDEELEYNEGRIRWRCCAQFDAGERVEVSTYLCLLLLSSTTRSTPARAYELFLIIEPVQVLGELKYKRIGLGNIDGASPTFDLERTMEICLV
ncbi:hypothetical protein NM208_g5227 [Fusarium decemcellulare]|uniref:Uncharacterized protein n=1 Tax=Fusarium decemcellulare TaxID=57161 RepID=A0ACC1SHW3_9HYPO|nr:hypothetical protein NM208_g5227 [Fusarium decemcellulare]